jgi:hypothetical protein
MKKSKRAGFMVASLFLMTACASEPRIQSDYDKAADFSRYRSFAFVSAPSTNDSSYRNLVTGRLKTAVQRELTSRGYVYRENDPDLLVNFSGRIEEKIYVDSVPMTAGPFMYHLYSPWPGLAAVPIADAYEEGTLNIDLVDRTKRQLVWQGTAVGVVPDGSLEVRQQKLDEVVTQIFTQYPFRVRPSQ